MIVHLKVAGAAGQGIQTTADLLGKDDRGVLAEGMLADVAVFDPETIQDKATYDDPHQFSVGIEELLGHASAGEYPSLADRAEAQGLSSEDFLQRGELAWKGL